MLIVSRKQDEGIICGDNLEVVVLRIYGERVMLGFRAPGTVEILRTEVFTRLKGRERLTHLRVAAEKKGSQAA